MVRLGIFPTTYAGVMFAFAERLPRIASQVKRDCGNLRPQLKDKNLPQLLAGAAGHYTDCRLNPSLFALFDHKSRRMEVVSAVGELAPPPNGAGLAGEGERAGFGHPYPSVLMERALVNWQSVHIPDLEAKPTVEVEFCGEEGIIEREVHSMDNVLSLLPRGFSRREGALLLTPLGIEGATEQALGLIEEYSPMGRFYRSMVTEARDLSAFFTWQIVEKYAEESGIFSR